MLNDNARDCSNHSEIFGKYLNARAGDEGRRSWNIWSDGAGGLYVWGKSSVILTAMIAQMFDVKVTTIPNCNIVVKMKQPVTPEMTQHHTKLPSSKLRIVSVYVQEGCHLFARKRYWSGWPRDIRGSCGTMDLKCWHPSPWLVVRDCAISYWSTRKTSLQPKSYIYCPPQS